MALHIFQVVLQVCAGVAITFRIGQVEESLVKDVQLLRSVDCQSGHARHSEYADGAPAELAVVSRMCELRCNV